MQNKRKSILVILVLISIVSANSLLYGQRPNMERMKAQRVAFFTDKLDLSEKEAQSFWPVYNDYSKSKEKINSQIRSIHQSYIRNVNELNEKEVEESLQQYVKLQSNSHQLFIKYNEKFLEILPPSKVMKLYITESQFKQYLLRQIGEERKQRMQGGRR